MDRSELANRMAVLLGGRAAENLVFKEISTGAADDLVKATDIARRMRSGTLVGPGTNKKLRPAIVDLLRLCVDHADIRRSFGAIEKIANSGYPKAPGRSKKRVAHKIARLLSMIYEISGGR